MKVSVPSSARARLDAQPDGPMPFVVHVDVGFATLGEALSFARRFDATPAERQQRRAGSRTEMIRYVRDMLARGCGAAALVDGARALNPMLVHPLAADELDALVLLVAREHLARRGQRA